MSLASKSQVLENCPVLALRTAVFFELLKICRSPEKLFEDLFLWRTHEPLSLVLGLEHSCPWP